MKEPTHKAVHLEDSGIGALCGAVPKYVTDAPEFTLSPNGPVTCEACLERMGTFQPWRKFQPDLGGTTPHGWIQWKNTHVCMDVHCGCGKLLHVDDSFTYFIKCEACGQVYEVSGFVELHPVDDEHDNAKLAKVIP